MSLKLKDECSKCQSQVGFLKLNLQDFLVHLIWSMISLISKKSFSLFLFYSHPFFGFLTLKMLVGFVFLISFFFFFFPCSLTCFL